MELFEIILEGIFEILYSYIIRIFFWFHSSNCLAVVWRQWNLTRFIQKTCKTKSFHSDVETQNLFELVYGKNLSSGKHKRAEIFTILRILSFSYVCGNCCHAYPVSFRHGWFAESQAEAVSAYFLVLHGFEVPLKANVYVNRALRDALLRCLKNHMHLMNRLWNLHIIISTAWGLTGLRPLANKQ